MEKYKVGEFLMLEGTGDFYPGIECIIMEVAEGGLYPTKIKAVTPDERLGRYGFIEENGEYYAVEWKWSPN